LRDGLRDGSFVVLRRQLARRIVRWFGSAARPAVRPTVRLGGVSGFLPDISLGSSVACPATCLTAHLSVRFGGVLGILPNSSLDDSV
jgi:hypothetical protein